MDTLKHAIDDMVTMYRKLRWDDPVSEIADEILAVADAYKNSTQTTVPLIDPSRTVAENYDLLWKRYASEPK